MTFLTWKSINKTSKNATGSELHDFLSEGQLPDLAEGENKRKYFLKNLDPEVIPAVVGVKGHESEFLEYANDEFLPNLIKAIKMDRDLEPEGLKFFVQHLVQIKNEEVLKHFTGDGASQKIIEAVDERLATEFDSLDLDAESLLGLGDFLISHNVAQNEVAAAVDRGEGIQFSMLKVREFVQDSEWIPRTRMQNALSHLLNARFTTFDSDDISGLVALRIAFPEVKEIDDELLPLVVEAANSDELKGIIEDLHVDLHNPAGSELIYIIDLLKKDHAINEEIVISTVGELLGKANLDINQLLRLRAAEFPAVKTAVDDKLLPLVKAENDIPSLVNIIINSVEAEQINAAAADRLKTVVPEGMAELKSLLNSNEIDGDAFNAVMQIAAERLLASLNNEATDVSVANGINAVAEFANVLETNPSGDNTNLDDKVKQLNTKVDDLIDELQLKDVSQLSEESLSFLAEDKETNMNDLLLGVSGQEEHDGGLIASATPDDISKLEDISKLNGLSQSYKDAVNVRLGELNIESAAEDVAAPSVTPEIPAETVKDAEVVNAPDGASEISVKTVETVDDSEDANAPDDASEISVKTVETVNDSEDANAPDDASEISVTTVETVDDSEDANAPDDASEISVETVKDAEDANAPADVSETPVETVEDAGDLIDKTFKDAIELHSEDGLLEIKPMTAQDQEPARAELFEFLGELIDDLVSYKGHDEVNLNEMTVDELMETMTTECFRADCEEQQANWKLFEEMLDEMVLADGNMESIDDMEVPEIWGRMGADLDQGTDFGEATLLEIKDTMHNKLTKVMKVVNGDENNDDVADTTETPAGCC